jgi:electron transfer flavoprotein alpha subunit
MHAGICVFVDIFQNKADPVVDELLSVARKISETTEEPVQAVLIADDCDSAIKDLGTRAFDQIYAASSSGISAFSDDSRSAIVAEMLRRIEPSCVIIPANSSGSSLFSRVAVKLHTGLTADCSELTARRRASGEYFILQNKPSFGDNIVVGIVNKEGIYPQMMTVRPGVCVPYGGSAGGAPQIRIFDDIAVPESAISLMETLPCSSGEELVSADVVVVGGRGAVSGGKFDLLRDFAEGIGGVLGGTRPVADEGIVPFENQIGQTGRTVRPRICLSFGVSGAIQHIEGIRDTKLFIAVNRDSDAPIFNSADYGVASDMDEILRLLVEKTGRARRGN